MKRCVAATRCCMQLVARPVHKGWSVAAIFRRNLSPSVFRPSSVWYKSRPDHYITKVLRKTKTMCTHTYEQFCYFEASQIKKSHGPVPNDGFLLDTLKTLFTFFPEYFLDLWEMYSKRRYGVCICSVILGELESSRNHMGFSTISHKF